MAATCPTGPNAHSMILSLFPLHQNASTTRITSLRQLSQHCHFSVVIAVFPSVPQQCILLQLCTPTAAYSTSLLIVIFIFFLVLCCHLLLAVSAAVSLCSDSCCWCCSACVAYYCCPFAAWCWLLLLELLLFTFSWLVLAVNAVWILINSPVPAITCCIATVANCLMHWHGDAIPCLAVWNMLLACFALAVVNIHCCAINPVNTT